MALIPGYLSGLQSDLLAEWQDRSRNLLYQSDPEAWMKDVLDLRIWSKQREMAQSVVDNVYTMVKSANGPGKSYFGAAIVAWFVSVFGPEETRVLLTAPVREQIDSIMFNYIRSHYQRAIDLGRPLVGEITKQPKWITEEPYRLLLAEPKRPADQNLISTFQGIHDDHVLVIMDEVGGLPREMFDAANAVTTNAHARILGMGNPNKRSTAFHDVFTDRERFGAWNTITISAFDIPTFTGETIHEDPVMDRKIKSGMTQPSWAEEVKRQAPDSVYRAQVLGEFPESDDDTFFPQGVIDTALDTKRKPDQYEALRALGVDLAFGGTDRSVVYFNDGGHVRLHKRLDPTPHHMVQARQIHQIALDLSVHEVRIDRSGIGDGVWSLLMTEPEFRGGGYKVMGVNGANKSPDINRFINARGWHYTQFRDGMANGEIDLSIKESELIQQIQRQPFKIDNRGRVVVLPKREMRLMGLSSPDDLDAAIYSCVDVTYLDDTNGAAPGETVTQDPWAMLDLDRMGLPV